jgi:hypothetical protein
MEAQQMTQRGRKSAASLVGPPVTGKPPRITAPSSLSIAEQTLFNELTGACDSSHFRKSDLPLLISYVQATRIAQAAAQAPETIAIWEKATRLQATLATRLRLSPQSRIDPKTLGRQDQPNLCKPWDPIVKVLKPEETEP